MKNHRAQAKESIAQAWHERRKQRQPQANLALSAAASADEHGHHFQNDNAASATRLASRSGNHGSGSVVQQPIQPGLPSLCALLQKARAEAVIKPIAASLPPRKKSTSTTNNKHHAQSTARSQVFPSVLPIMQAHVLAQQVEFLQSSQRKSNDKTVPLPVDDLRILPTGYDWDTAVQNMATSRSRAFWLYDLATPIRRLVRWQQQQQPAGTIRFLYRVAANADAILLQVLQRHAVGFVVQSNWDLEQCRQAVADEEDEFLLYDDTTLPATRPDSFLRRAVLGPAKNGRPSSLSMRVLTIGEPDDVGRITQALERLIERSRRQRGQQPPDKTTTMPSIQFLLRLPSDDDTNAWTSLVTNTLQQIRVVQSQLAGISVDLSLSRAEPERIMQRQQDVEHLVSTVLSHIPDLRIDITGLTTEEEWQEQSDWLTRLTTLPNVRELTLDATEALTATCAALCTRIIGVKIMPDQRHHYYVDDGCYGSLSQPQPKGAGSTNTKEEGASYHPIPLGVQAEPPLLPSTVWGPTCDGLDRICPHAELPALQRDDWLVFPHWQGASGQGLGTAFNGFCPPDTVYCVLSYFR